MYTMEHKLSYLAGFLDGDGTITVSHYNRSRKATQQKAHHVVIGAAQLKEHREPLDTLKFMFGGHIHEKTVKGRPLLHWRLCGYKAGEAIRHLYPYLVVKHKVATLALLFHYSREDRLLVKKGRSYRLSDEDVRVGCVVSKACSYFNGKGRNIPAVSNQIN